LKGDNRTVVATPDQSTPDTAVVTSDIGAEGDTHGLDTAITSTDPAFSLGVAEGEETITVVEGGGGLSKNDLRTQYFHTGNYDSSQRAFGAKRCFVNIKGQPLDANGDPTDVASAVDAETTDLSALGEAVTSYAQVYRTDGTRTPVPGTYQTNVRQTALYAPYVGYTAQHDAS
jgi:hypothetical protein